MKTRAILQEYAALADLMTRERIYTDSTVTFKELCRRVQTRPRRMNRLLRAELGMDGTALLQALRDGTLAALARNYGPLGEK